MKCSSGQHWRFQVWGISDQSANPNLYFGRRDIGGPVLSQYLLSICRSRSLYFQWCLRKHSLSSAVKLNRTRPQHARFPLLRVGKWLDAIRQLAYPSPPVQLHNSTLLAGRSIR